MRSSIERIRKDIERLATFTATPGSGVTRYSFSEEDRKARDYIRREMEDAGLRPYEDGAGNLFGRRDGRRNDAPPVMVGSHFDSVPNGGAFDGDAGVSTALEIARILRAGGLRICPDSLADDVTPVMLYEDLLQRGGILV